MWVPAVIANIRLKQSLRALNISQNVNDTHKIFKILVPDLDDVQGCHEDGDKQ
jgi:hypothetical protein